MERHRSQNNRANDRADLNEGLSGSLSVNLDAKYLSEIEREVAVLCF